MTKIITGQNKCPKCGNQADPEDWRPPAGMDPHLFKFRCGLSACRHTWYDRVTNPERRAAIQARLVEISAEDDKK